MIVKDDTGLHHTHKVLASYIYNTNKESHNIIFHISFLCKLALYQ